MNYEEAKKHSKELNEKVNLYVNELKKFDELGLTEIGLTPDHVRALPEWKITKKNFDESFAELRNFNTWFVKTYKKEILEDKRKKYSR